MDIELTVTKVFDVKFLQASCGVRYWEDATVDGVSDESGVGVPCKNGDNWEPLIDLEAGVILNWEKGKTADIYFKVCDCGEYTLLDTDKNEVKKIDGYVPEIMCPEGDGYGDYVCMKIDGEGKIAKWNLSFDEFNKSQPE